jgi:hypothetical protein
MAAIDPTRPFYLIKEVVGRDGNVYPPSKDPCNSKDIPVKYQTTEYCSQLPVNSQPDPVSPSIRLDGRTDEEKARDSKVTINPVITITPPTSAPTTKRQVNVNADDVETIMDVLDGIGRKTAEKVVSEREDLAATENRFTTIEELNTKIPLGFGRKWDTYADQITFKASDV